MSERYYSTIIVPVLQNSRILELFIDSLLDSILPNSQVILINDGSGENISGYLDSLRKRSHSKIRIEIIHHDYPNGSVQSLNQGIEKAEGDYIFFIDSDVILSPNWHLELINTLINNKDIGLVSSILIYPQTGGIQHCGLTFTTDIARHLFLNNKPECLSDQLLYVQSVVFALIGIKRDVLNKIGEIDSGFFNGYEDLDFCFRAKEAGYKIAVNPKVISFHWEKSNGIHRSINRKKNLGRFWRKWGNAIDADLWTFVKKEIKNNLVLSIITKNVVCLDLCEVRDDAATLIQILNEDKQINIVESYNYSYLLNGSNIWLPEILNKDFYRTPFQIIFIVDNFNSLLNNMYWFELRRTIRDDDIIIDLHANLINLKKLQISFWPGTKTR